MNSDPHESAAWRTFGMLDADEAAAFDEAMRHDPELRQAFLDMQGLTAAVAAASVQPVAPPPGQLERLERQLGLHTARRTNWAAISGWAAAAAVTLLVLVNRETPSARAITSLPAPSPAVSPTVLPAAAPEEEEAIDGMPSFTEKGEPAETALHGEPVILGQEDAKVLTRQESRLIQQIEVLQEQVQDLQQRDRGRFEPVPGTAWPIVMQMRPPGVPAEASNISFDHQETPMTAILGDALASANDGYDQGVDVTGGVSKTGLLSGKTSPSAVPIYDAARDTGTLVVNNLPDTVEGESYNLWVIREGESKPIHLGRLPQSNARATDSFDFSLGSVGVVPAGFILTRDLRRMPSAPTPASTILQGP